MGIVVAHTPKIRTIDRELTHDHIAPNAVMTPPIIPDQEVRMHTTCHTKNALLAALHPHWEDTPITRGGARVHRSVALVGWTGERGVWQLPQSGCDRVHETQKGPAWLQAHTGARDGEGGGGRMRRGGQGCIRREGTSEGTTEAVRQAVGGGCRSGWGR